MSSRTIFTYACALVPLLFLGCASSTITTSTSDMTTVYIVRHAEKLNTESDTPLSPAGEERAIALADRLADAKVQQIYATTRLRTQQTVGVLAKRLGLEPVLLDPGSTGDLVTRIKASDHGKVVLVAGHSNTVADIVNGLSGKAVEALPEDRFDRLFRVDIMADGTAEVAEMRYGAPTP